MGQHGKPQNDRRDHGALDAPTTPLTIHRAGPLGSLHDGQRRWHPFARFLWWAFLLPVAIFAWSSARLRGAFRVGGYVLAGWVLLIGLIVVSAPATPPPTTTAASAGQVVPAQVATPVDSAPVETAPAQNAVALAPAAPAPVAPVRPAPAARAAATPAALAPSAPVARHAAPSGHSTRPAPRAPSRPRPAPVHTSAPSTGDTYTNVDGNQVQRPVASAAQPSGATAKCKDGTWSFSQHRSGTCSGHGGVASWL